MKVTLLGNLDADDNDDDDDDDDGGRRGGAEIGPRLTLNDRGKERRDRACWTSSIISSSSSIFFTSTCSPPLLLVLLASTTRSCDRKCLMFCLAAWTNRSSSSTPRMWAGSNLRAMARVM